MRPQIRLCVACRFVRPPPHELAYTARGAAMSYGWVGGTAPLDMTSVTDGRTHAIAVADFDAGLWAGQGRYRAICGAQVIAHVRCLAADRSIATR